MKKKIKIILIIFSILFLIGVLIGLKMYYQKPITSVEKQKVEFKLNAGEILNEFENDETAANEKYLDKVIQVTGTVEKVNSENMEVIIYLKDKESIGGVMCSFDESSTDYKNIVVGETVSIKGICTGYLLDVVLKKCSLN